VGLPETKHTLRMVIGHPGDDVTYARDILTSYRSRRRTSLRLRRALSSPWTTLLPEVIFHQALGVVEGSEDVVTNEVEAEELSRSTGRRTTGPSTNTVSTHQTRLQHVCMKSEVTHVNALSRQQFPQGPKLW